MNIFSIKVHRVVLNEESFNEALQQGNKVVFEQVFRDYYERLCNYANTILNDMDEAEEVVQGTFLILWEKRSGIRIHTALKSYLYQSVHNSCLNRLDHLKVREAHREYFIHNSETMVDSGAQPAMTRELENRIEQAVTTLPPQCQTVFRLSRFGGLSYAEIARQLDISLKTVENHMGKALKIMRDQLKDYLPLLMWFLFRSN